MPGRRPSPLLALCALLLCGCRPAPPPRPPFALLAPPRGPLAARLGFPEAVAGDGLLATGPLRALRAAPSRSPLERGRWRVRHARGPGATLRFSGRSLAGTHRRLPLPARLGLRNGALLVPAGPAVAPALAHLPLHPGVVRSDRVAADPSARLALEVAARPGAPAFAAGHGWCDPWHPRSEGWRHAAWVAVPLPRGWLLATSGAGVRLRVEPTGERGGRRWALLGRRLRWTLATTVPEGLLALFPARQRAVLRLPRGLPPGARVRVLDAAGRPWLDVPTVAAKGSRLRLPLPGGPGEASARLEQPGRRRGPAVPLRATEQALPPLPKGGVLALRVTDGRGRPLAVRVRLEALKDAPQPDLGPDWLASGAGEAVVAEAGRLRLSLPAGRYRVRLSHGPTFSAASLEVRVRDDAVVERRLALRREVDPGDWVAADLHLHAAPSVDSRVSLADRVRSLRAEGIRFAVATDHNRVTDYGTALEALAPALRTAPGVEVTTWAPAFGHFNVYPVPLRPEAPRGGAPPFQGLDPVRLFAELRRRYPRALVQVCHPRLEPDIGYFDLFGFDPRRGRARRPRFSLDFDVLEVFNGYDLARPERVEQVLADWRALLARGRRVVGVGSSDSHLVRFQWAGYPRTWVHVPGSAEGPIEPAAFFEALRAGRAVVSSGPLLQLELVEARIEGEDACGPLPSTDVRRPGETAHLTETPGETLVARVRLRAPRWMALRGEVLLWTARGVLARLPLPSEQAGEVERLRARVPLRLRREDRFVLATFRSETTLDGFFGRGGVTPLAFTNPVWLE